jgi:toxin ParE1/3/4
MTAVTFTPSARRDVREILQYIARDSRRNGERFVARIELKCRELAAAPSLGNPVPWLDGIHYWQIQRYVIVFRRTSEAFVVLRVMHGARDWMGLLENDPEE